MGAAACASAASAWEIAIKTALGRLQAPGDLTDAVDDAGFVPRVITVADVDRDKLKGVLEEAQHLGAGAASLIGAHGEKLADRAPGAFDKLAGAAKEKLGTLTGDEGLIGEGQIERFKGKIKETIASVSEMADSRSKDAAEAIKTKVDETRRNEPKSP